MKKNLIKILLLLVFLIIVGVGFLLYYKDKQKKEASLALSDVEKRAEKDKGEGFKKVATKHPNTEAGNTAWYRRAQCLMRTGDYKEAISSLKQCKIKREDMLYLEYNKLLGNCYKGLKQYKDALLYYRDALKCEGCDDMKGDILFGMYAIYRQNGEIRDAKDCLNRICKEYPAYRDVNKVKKLIVALSPEIDGNR